MKTYKKHDWPNFCAVDKREWTAKQAKEYLEWMKSSIDEREKILLEHLGIEEKGVDHREELIRVGNRFENEIANTKYQAIELLPEIFRTKEKESQIALTTEGEEIAFDLALYTAKKIMSIEDNKFEWAIVRKPKNDISINCPIITDGRKLRYDPVLVTTANAHACLNGWSTENQWIDVYDLFKEKCARI